MIRLKLFGLHAHINLYKRIIGVMDMLKIPEVLYPPYSKLCTSGGGNELTFTILNANKTYRNEPTNSRRKDK